MRRPALALLLLAVALPASAAQSPPAHPPLPPLPPPAPAAATPPAEALPPYEESLERLAELLGTLAFMRDLCGPQTGPDWREKMTGLLESEGITDRRRARLAGRFNRSYEDYRLTYRTCTPAAGVVVARALAEGTRLSATLSKQFLAD